MNNFGHDLYSQRRFAPTLFTSSESFIHIVGIRNPGTVKRFSDDFDDQFAFLCEEKGVEPKDSRLVSIEEIDREITALTLLLLRNAVG